jgi:S-adenosylmethionine synthetase
VGKLYNVLALLIAREIHRQVEDVREVKVQLLSAIGDRIDEPQLASIDIVASGELSAAARAQAARIADRWLADIPRVTGMILDERVALF